MSFHSCYIPAHSICLLQTFLRCGVEPTVGIPSRDFLSGHHKERILLRCLVSCIREFVPQYDTLGLAVFATDSIQWFKLIYWSVMMAGSFSAEICLSLALWCFERIWHLAPSYFPGGTIFPCCLVAKCASFKWPGLWCLCDWLIKGDAHFQTIPVIFLSAQLLAHGQCRWNLFWGLGHCWYLSEERLCSSISTQSQYRNVLRKLHVTMTENLKGENHLFIM